MRHELKFTHLLEKKDLVVYFSSNALWSVIFIIPHFAVPAILVAPPGAPDRCIALPAPVSAAAAAAKGSLEAVKASLPGHGQQRALADCGLSKVAPL